MRSALFKKSERPFSKPIKKSGVLNKRQVQALNSEPISLVNNSCEVRQRRVPAKKSERLSERPVNNKDSKSNKSRTEEKKSEKRFEIPVSRNTEPCPSRFQAKKIEKPFVRPVKQYHDHNKPRAPAMKSEKSLVCDLNQRRAPAKESEKSIEPPVKIIDGMNRRRRLSNPEVTNKQVPKKSNFNRSRRSSHPEMIKTKPTMIDVGVNTEYFDLEAYFQEKYKTLDTQSCNEHESGDTDEKILINYRRSSTRASTTVGIDFLRTASSEEFDNVKNIRDKFFDKSKTFSLANVPDRVLEYLGVTSKSLCNERKDLIDDAMSLSESMSSVSSTVFFSNRVLVDGYGDLSEEANSQFGHH
eukprot:GHVL01027232.1.p1 GENE.GHVL01027232.1~~GHVL01027232.1.p1  ORF type:complete len:414 (+),score=68.68 GHVL01027232.1:176-1243(+)